ncbi:hypothetical protein J2I47_00915 [Fibrella sp. HMF5335]|uniref:Bacteriophage Mx8 p63 C-terminal domain-containing protein n=1 Tax=Fibrella rubiginis TaxID=2817060 RepID=A0A939K473_9BACT|nr:P63C domain-containing protein [Fibrella rubiginis]MBO0935095.1 hypothetical protein [Fibrella rubiginis]
MSKTKKTTNLNEVKKPKVKKLSPEEEKRQLYSNIKNFVDVQGTDEALDRKNEKFSLSEYRRRNKNSSNPMIGEAKPHVVTFPRPFYTELLRLLGLPYDEESLKRKPKILARITNEIIYLRFPKGTLKELQNRNPITTEGYRLLKHFQLLTDLGEAHLKQFIDGVIEEAKDCVTYSQLYNRLRKKAGDSWQLNLFEEYN